MSRTRTFLVLVAMSSVVAIGPSCGTGDRLEVPTPRRDAYVDMALTCLYALSQEDVILGGYLTPLDGGVEGILLRTHDGGDTWRRIGSETHEFDGFLVQAIHFNDSLRGWVSGIRTRRGETIPSILRTQNGGGLWRETEIPESRAALVSNVSELAFTSDDEGTVNVVFYDDLAGEPTANVYETRDGGRNWIIKDFANDADEGLTDPALMFFSESQGYRLDPPLPNGTQILSYSATNGKVWVPRAQLHLSQFPLYY